MPNLTPEDHDIIAEKTVAKLTENNRAIWVDRETHYEHHKWIERRQSDEEIARQFKRKIIQAGVIWAMLPLLGFLFWSVSRAIINFINTQGGPTP